MREFGEAYDEGRASATTSYMAASAPFATRWQSFPGTGLPARKAVVWQPSVTGPQPRGNRLRMREVSCAYCGDVAAKLKKCGRCKRTFYCSREHQEKVCAQGTKRPAQIQADERGAAGHGLRQRDRVLTARARLGLYSSSSSSSNSSASSAQHWNEAHGRVCEEFDEAKLRAYDYEVFFDFQSTTCRPWGEEELGNMSRAYPNAVLQLCVPLRARPPARHYLSIPFAALAN